MVGDNLNRYVRTQCDNNVDPNFVRYTLIKSGWPPNKVDEAIAHVYSRKDMHVPTGNKHLLRWLVIVILVIVAAMILTYTQVMNHQPKTEPKIIKQPEPVSEDCPDISDSVQKDECYYEKVSQGFDCNVLTNDIERNFCFRALDRYSMAY